MCLLNKAACRRWILDQAARLRPSSTFVGVSEEYLEQLAAMIRVRVLADAKAHRSGRRIFNP